MLLDKKRGVWAGKGQKAAHAGFAGGGKIHFSPSPAGFPRRKQNPSERAFLKEDEAR